MIDFNIDIPLQGTAGEWRIVFFLSAGIYIFGAVFYDLLASADVQEWAKSNPREEDVELNKDGTPIGQELNDLKFAKTGHGNSKTDPLI